jgi:hypothetical protein
MKTWLMGVSLGAMLIIAPEQSIAIDREGRAVGLIFDGNIHSLGGDFTFDATRNRAVAVDSAALLEAIKKVYRLPRLAEELASP